MIRHKGIAFQLGVYILTGVSLIFLSAFGVNYFISRKLILKNLENNAENLTLNIVNQIDSVLAPIQKITETAAIWIENTIYTKEELLDVLRESIGNNPEVYGGTIAFEPFQFDPDRLYFAPYFYKQGKELLFTYIGNKDYHYFYSDWYVVPKELNRSVWSEPYFDEGAGNILMSTYSSPFYQILNGERVFKGIITMDISLEWLQKVVSSIRVLDTGYGFLISQNGAFVTHPVSRFIMNETLFSLNEEHDNLLMRKIGRNMIRQKTGFIRCQDPVTRVEGYLFYAPVHSNGWSLGVFFPADEALEDIHELNRIVIFLAIFGISVLGLVIAGISRNITRPLHDLTNAVHSASTGNLDAQLPPARSRDEVGRLTESFSRMQTSLKEYIHNLTETTAAKERIESELKIAHDIQMGILPKSFPGPPACPQFSLWADLVPAKEVGGDLYDFFFLDAEHLCFTVGDVSGKGVPASLFMAITRTLIKIKAIAGINPAEVLTHVNHDLSVDNPSMMFVTMFLGVLNFRTGELVYCNAGHNPPYLVSGENDIQAVHSEKCIALGVWDGFEFHHSTTRMNPGQTLFLYTDGITESINESEEQFGESRLVASLSRCAHLSTRDMLDSVYRDVQNHAVGMPQFDDITMLALRFLDGTQECEDLTLSG
jgi:sigma-B regulation protein RsbU (phosphoserine phosphatase)